MLFPDRLAEAVERKRSQLLVGLDPRPDLLPVELAGDAHLSTEAAAEACGRFCCGIVDAVAPHVVGVKPQLAFFEALGADGLRAFEDVCAYARSAGLVVLADAKRGDIGSTSRAYATAYLEPRGEGPPVADAMTVNPYLGRDSLEPFLGSCRRHGGGIFCIVKTSNEGGADVQDLKLSDGHPVWHHVALLVHELGEELVGERGLSSVGAVVERPTRARSARRGGCCRRRSCSCRASARRARPRPTSPARSRAARRAHSSTPPAASSTPFATGRRTGAPPPPPRPRGYAETSGPSPAGSR